MTNQKVLRAHDFLPPTFSEDRNVLTVAEVAAAKKASALESGAHTWQHGQKRLPFCHTQ